MNEWYERNNFQLSTEYLRSIFSINLGEYPGPVKAQGYGLKTAEMAGGIEIEII